MIIGSSKDLLNETLDDDEQDHVVIARDFAAEDESFTHFPVPELNGDDSDDEIAYENVEDPPTDGPPLRKDPLEIIIEKAPGAKELKKAGKGDSNRRPPPTPAERAARQDLHKSHVLCLLAHGRSRNALLNDETLQARLMSKAPLALQDAFYAFSRQSHPNERERSRLFDIAMKKLVAWWWLEFDVDQSLSGVHTRAYGDIAKELVKEGVFSVEDLLSILDEDGAADHEVKVANAFGAAEVIKSAQSMMKRAVQMKGTRDMSAQLFTSLCRALGIPARLIFSLQPIDWRATAAATDASVKATKKRKREPAEKPKYNGKGKGKASTTETEDSEDLGEFEEVVRGSSSKPISLASGTNSRASSRAISINSTEDESEASTKSRAKKPVKLRRSKPAKSDRSPSPDATSMAIQPVFWTEVYSRSSKEWIPVDVTRRAFRSRSIMEPPKANPHNKMQYVVAFEEDGFLRDVTPRYAKQFGAATVKNRVPSKKGEDWWDAAISPLKRPYTLDRDVKEDEELLKSQVTETMPTSVGGFKDHPLYALERHLKREEVIHPRKKLGLFRTEEVFPRSSVIACRSAEQWMREGRKVKEREQPLKMVKQRAVTIGKVRAQEAAIAEGEEPLQQGLYARYQTELAKSAPVKDGKVPRNAFGNIDLYADHMIPKGGTHLPHKGIAKVAKKLGVDFAEAITGFEFHKRRAIPVASGIVVPSESAEAVLDAYWEMEHASAEKQQAKKEERIMKRWKLLFKGMLLRDRLHADYKSGTSSPVISMNGRNELARLEANESEDVSMDSDAIHSAPSAPAKLSNTLRSLEKGHAGASKRKTLLTGSGAVDLSSESEEEAEQPVAKPKKKASAPKRKRAVVEIDAESEDEDKEARPARRSKRRAKADSDEEDASIAISRPRRRAANGKSYNERHQVMSEDEEVID